MECTIQLPGIDGISNEKIAEFWRDLFDGEEIPYSVEFWEDGNYTMKVDEIHQASVWFFVDNGCIEDWAKCEC